jgi:hypothetical protein
MMDTTTLLSNFMRLAVQKTGAERALALDQDLAIIASYEINQSGLLDSSFVGIEAARQALDTGEVVITNNVSKDAASPTTNTTFRDLRFIVVIPVGELGAVYLDQSMRLGAIPRAPVQNLSGLASLIAAQQESALSPDQIAALYETMG